MPSWRHLEQLFVQHGAQAQWVGMVHVRGMGLNRNVAQLAEQVMAVQHRGHAVDEGGANAMPGLHIQQSTPRRCWRREPGRRTRPPSRLV